MGYFILFLWALVPVVLSVVFYLLKRKTQFCKIPKVYQQIIIGVFFGIVSIFGTEFGVAIDGATLNVRDAAPLCAGLLFGGPSGIIAGIIGGVERWFAAYWGAGAYTQLACTIGTIFSGIYAAFVRKFLFEGKRPGAKYAFVTGVVTEVVHMLLVFITHLDNPQRAIEVVKICSIPMIFLNGLSVFLAAFLVSILSKEINVGRKKRKKIADGLQNGLLILVLAGYLATTIFVYALQTGTSQEDVKELFAVNIKDVRDEIVFEADSLIISKANLAAKEYEQNPDIDIAKLAANHEISEINIVDDNGIVVKSTNSENINFDMSSSEITAEFLVLIDSDIKEYVQEYRNDVLSGEGEKYAAVSLNDGGFIQVGYEPSTYYDEFENIIFNLSAFRHIGTGGHILIANEDYEIVSADLGLGIKTLNDEGISINGENKDNTILNITINGVDYIGMYDYAEGYIIAAFQSKDEVFSSRDNAIYVNSFVQMLIFGILLIFVYMFVNHAVVKPIYRVNESLKKIIGGNLDEKVNERTADELIDLSDDINSTVASLKEYVEQEKERIGSDLQIAKGIQLSALPIVSSAYKKVYNFDIAVYIDTAKEVGGDFYDFYMLSNTKIAFLIADVSGKGVPAALFMMTAKTIIKNAIQSGYSIDEAITIANNNLCESNEAGMFVTCWVGILDIETGHLEFVNAGHNPPVIYKNGEGYSLLKTKAGFVLAGMDGFTYKKLELDLQPGEKIYLYTDGVTEATNAGLELYGEDRLLKVLNSHSNEKPVDVLDTVTNDVNLFVGGAEQADDITMLMIQYNGPKPSTIETDEVTFDADDANLSAALEFIDSKLEAKEVSMKINTQIDIAVEELFVNVCHYAYGDGTGTVTLKTLYDTETRDFSVTLIDTGTPFNPLNKEDPDITLSAEDRQIGGLGIYMVVKTMDDVSYEYKHGENRLTIVKKV